MSISPAVLAAYAPEPLLCLALAAAVKSVELYPDDAAYRAHREQARVTHWLAGVSVLRPSTGRGTVETREIAHV